MLNTANTFVHYEHPTTRHDGTACDHRTLVAIPPLKETCSFIVICSMKGKWLPTYKPCYASSAFEGLWWHRLFWISGLDLPKHSGKKTALNLSCNRHQLNDSCSKKSHNMRCLIEPSSGEMRKYYQELKKSVKTSYLSPCGKYTCHCGECRYTHSSVKIYRLNYCSLPTPKLDEEADRYIDQNLKFVAFSSTNQIFLL